MSEAFNPRERELCVDGACVGLIGQDGYCRECGKPGASAKLDPRRRGLRDDEEVAEELAARVIEGDLPSAPEDFEDRELCPDGTCIGVIGADGRCKECGRRGSGAREQGGARAAAVEGADERLHSDAGDEDVEDVERDEHEDAGDQPESAPAEAESDRFDKRELCPDGACIGVIGADGRCKECGRQA